MANTNQIHDLFGSFRAEWLREDIFELFSEPAYFPHLLGNKSCVLMGGRGSGKTTALRCLSYQGQIALGHQNWKSPSHVGIYYRVNTNVVTAFEGPELEAEEWRRLFGHFLNLTICEEFAKYVVSYCDQNSIEELDASFRLAGESLGIYEVKTPSDLIDGISSASTKLEIYINNLGGERPTISQIQSPISKMMNAMKRLPGHKEVGFHIVLDEYENFLDYQQMVVNTLIKHSGDNCYFKIGVRELGWRIHTTLNENESLISPSDYELIHIEERLKDDFEIFARRVCESRLESNRDSVGCSLKLDALLPSLSTIEESERLGVSKKVSKFRSQIEQLSDCTEQVHDLHDFAFHVFGELNKWDADATLLDLIKYSKSDKTATGKYHNHSHALLFSIADRGSSITKHYCGHETFARLANRNIRFYMQLVHESIVQQISEKKDLSSAIDCKDQTVAARRVGLNYLRELEGATARGSHLSKLILGFGRFFQILAANPVGGSPEKNQFHLRDAGEAAPQSQQTEAASLLTEAIMHLALVRSPGTKLAAENDTHAWDYSPHPIFAPYFNYSSRRKRKAEITDGDLISMSKSPQVTIRKLLGQNRQHLAESDLPPQMSMFDDFFK